MRSEDPHRPGPMAQDLPHRKEEEETRRTSEAQQRESQKMEAIGMLAHDFNNILGAILGNVELARMDLGENPGVRQSLDEIWRAGQRAKELVRQIFAFSRQDHAELRPIPLLPVVEEVSLVPVEPPPTREARPARDDRPDTILYIDDDEALLSLVRRLLQKDGHTVEVFTDPHEALEALRSDADRFDLVLSDYNMPRFSGLDVARAVQRIAPAVPVAITSGFITEELRNEGRAAGVRAVIPKTDLVEDLYDAIRRILAEVQRT